MSLVSGVDQVQDDDDNINPHRGLGWRDNIRPFMTAKGAGTAEPTWSDMGNGIYGMKFTAGDELFTQYHIDHDYAKGTKAFPHIHFISTVAENAGASVTWRYSYVIARGHAQGESLTAATQSIDITYVYTGNEVAGDHIVVECGEANAIELLEPDTILIAGVKLQAEDAAGSIFGIMSDLHYQVDRLSTRRKAPDFYVR